MSLLKNVGTIGGLTAISRLFGFARDMMLARVLGAGLAADAFQLAFTLPNTFRRLFAEGAFSVAFVPMYSRALHGEGGEAAAEKFAADVLAVFIWVLLAFSALAMVIMPGIVWVLAKEYQSVPGKFELSVMLSRVTFPYLGLVSLVAMLSGLLNARSRFAPGAFAPVLLNLTLITGILTGAWLRGPQGDDTIVATALAVSVSLAGVVQLAYMARATRKAGVKLKVTLPKLTPEVKRLGALILPATFGAGIYQVSQFVDTFFATQLPQGSLTLLKLADRLNQMPLGIVGIALGTAILPMLSRHIHSGEAAEAQKLQTQAFEMATLLTLPAAAALAVCAPAFTAAFFVGGKFTAGDGAIMAQIVVALVAGLPAYVIVKILNPGFFAREDTRTPVWTALVALVFNVVLNVFVVRSYGIVGLAAATACSASLNCLLLYAILHRRGWFRFTLPLASKIARQLVATAAMAGALIWVMPLMATRYHAGVIDRIWSLSVLVGLGLAVFGVVAFATGAVDKRVLGQLRRRRPKRTAEDDEILEVQ
ncbi:murein biosynthesis integral membrane protein MurJ [Novosphingobium sp. PS1R-30]|uniref:Probable lipid II flippase MurJ n=1 Tax=Novosphingobium anseongense TaxID=3133436 RepID=A0ABU8RX23_9SPHN|nr:MAG: murein biosynthesis integral membrane protein MurJ [Novosphingobium sp.]